MTRRFLVSGGGLDSAALLYSHAFGLVFGDSAIPPGEDIDVLHLDYGQTSTGGEAEAIVRQRDMVMALFGRTVRAHAASMGKEEIGPQDVNPNSALFGGTGDPFIRGRNLWLLVTATNGALEMYGTAEPIELQMGLTTENMMFSDANPDFIHKVRELFRISYGNLSLSDARPLVTVTAPVLETGTPKQKILDDLYGRFLNRWDEATAQRALWENTWTCWTPTPEGAECGTCYHCTKRARLRREIEYNYRPDFGGSE